MGTVSVFQSNCELGILERGGVRPLPEHRGLHEPQNDVPGSVLLRARVVRAAEGLPYEEAVKALPDLAAYLKAFPDSEDAERFLQLRSKYLRYLLQVLMDHAFPLTGGTATNAANATGQSCLSTAIAMLAAAEDAPIGCCALV